MAIDTPAHLVILGAGPIGLETALYARFLGYNVTVFERGQLAANVREWSHVRMFTPFSMNSSPLGLRALQAQDEQFQAPDPTALLTGGEWIENYLQPLSETDLLSSHIQTNTEVIALSRTELLKRDFPADRTDLTIRVLTENQEGEEQITEADAVIDTTGTWRQPNYMGPGGAPAQGERACRHLIRYHIPSNDELASFAGKHTILVGVGMSAATTAVALGKIASEHPTTRVSWILRQERGEQDPLLPGHSEDPLVERARLVESANQLRNHDRFTIYSGSWIEQVSEAGSGFQLQLGGQHAGELQGDQLIANVGFRPDRELYRELQVHECYASEGPMKLAACLLEDAGSDCLEQQPHGAASLQTPEPDFYILGAKSYGRRSNFLLSIGLEQIRQLFSLIGDRPDLDLYGD